MEPKRLINASAAGGVLAILAVGLFLLIYVVLGSTEVSSATRLFGALCTPPVVIGAVVLGYSALRKK